MKMLGLIPARAGSKGIKKKNIRNLIHKPLYEWVTRVAIGSNCFDRIVISSDMQEIIYGEFQHLVQIRPKRLCKDKTTTQEVARFVLEKNPGFDLIAIIQPTSPFLRKRDIQDCLEIIEWNKKINSVQTIRLVKHLDHAYNQRLFNRETKKVVFAFPDKRANVQKQSQPRHYALGNLIITKVPYFLKTNDFFGISWGIEIPQIYGMDIDYQSDIDLATAAYKEGLTI